MIYRDTSWFTCAYYIECLNALCVKHKAIPVPAWANVGMRILFYEHCALFIQMLGELVLYVFLALTGESFEENLPWLSPLTLKTPTLEKKLLWMRSVGWPSFSTKSFSRSTASQLNMYMYLMS